MGGGAVQGSREGAKLLALRGPRFFSPFLLVLIFSLWGGGGARARSDSRFSRSANREAGNPSA
eukprot:55059-Pyramimonas_sp.AAC.1